MATLLVVGKLVLICGFLLCSTQLTAGWVYGCKFLQNGDYFADHFQRPYRMYHHNVSAYSLSDKVAINASIINTRAVSLFIDAKKSVDRLFIRFEVYLDSGSGTLDLKYLNETIDMCRIFREKTYLPFIQIIYRAMVEQGNYPTSCPIMKVNSTFYLCPRYFKCTHSIATKFLKFFLVVISKQLKQNIDCVS